MQTSLHLFVTRTSCPHLLAYNIADKDVRVPRPGVVVCILRKLMDLHRNERLAKVGREHQGTTVIDKGVLL